MWFSGFLPELTISTGLGRNLISRHTPQAIGWESCRAAGIFCAPGNPPKNGGPLLPLHHLKFLKARFLELCWDKVWTDMITTPKWWPWWKMPRIYCHCSIFGWWVKYLTISFSSSERSCLGWLSGDLAHSLFQAFRSGVYTCDQVYTFV